MEIKAKGKLDLDAIKALTHLSMFRKGDPKKRMTLLSVLYIILALDLVILGAINGFDKFTVILVAFAVVVVAIESYMYFAVPKIKYKAMAKLKDAENEYLFMDSSVKITTSVAEYSGEGEMEYTLFVRAYETSRYLFLYQTKNQAFIIDKSSVENSDFEQIRKSLLSAIGEKYVVCNY